MMSLPACRAVGEGAILIAFGDRIDPAIHARVMACDQAVRAAGLAGVIETVPAYASLLVVFDPLVTDHEAVEAAIAALDEGEGAGTATSAIHRIMVDYDGPDLAAVAAQCGLAASEVASLHASVEYRVFMGGFAPGYAYLGEVPEALRLPRKARPESGHPPGSVLIAGGQCLVSTLPMPTGWWVIGHSRAAVFDPAAADPFLLKPGDIVRFSAA